jgi:hypothetical protein
VIALALICAAVLSVDYIGFKALFRGWERDWR